jgi:hypothetical protein
VMAIILALGFFGSGVFFSVKHLFCRTYVRAKRAQKRARRNRLFAAEAGNVGGWSGTHKRSECEGGALLRRKRASEGVVGGRPPEPPPRPARLPMLLAQRRACKTVYGRVGGFREDHQTPPAAGDVALVLGRTCARPHKCSLAQVLARTSARSHKSMCTCPPPY